MGVRPSARSSGEVEKLPLFAYLYQQFEEVRLTKHRLAYGALLGSWDHRFVTPPTLLSSLASNYTQARLGLQAAA